MSVPHVRAGAWEGQNRVLSSLEPELQEVESNQERARIRTLVLGKTS